MSILIARDWLDFFIAYLYLTNNKQAEFLFIYFKKCFEKWLLKLRDNSMGGSLFITTIFLNGGRPVPTF